MSGSGDGENDASKRNMKNIKGLWRDAFRTLKSSTTSSSSSPEDEARPVSSPREKSRPIDHLCILDLHPMFF